MKKILIAVLSFICFAPVAAHAQLHLNLNKGVMNPMPVAIPQFSGSGEMAAGIPGVVAADLGGSGLFKVIDSQAYLQDAGQNPRFDQWRATGAQALITGAISDAGGGKTRVEFRLWDVFQQKQEIGMAYTTTNDNWRRIAHIIADDIYKQMTGEDGYFDSRIVYISESGPMTHREKRLAIIDQDGANARYLTDGSALVLTPRFSPTRQQITYMSYERGAPRVYLYDLASGSRQLLGDFPGMTFAPRFSPDGNTVVMSLAEGGNSDIYALDLASRSKRRLTQNASINTAPSYAPDGRQIAFESDRGGTQQIYVMNADGSNQHRISFGQGRYGNPVWSPRGDLIAFTRIYNGQFYIGVIHPDGSGEREIVNAWHVEGPTWSPNGRVLSYFKQLPGGGGETAHLYTIDITGYNERTLQTPEDASDPAWSPLNK